MIVLSPTQTLQVVLSGAVTTNECPVITSFVTVSGSKTGPVKTEVPDVQIAVTTGATAVTALTAPSTGSLAAIKSISFYNKDTVAVTVTFQMLVGSTVYIIKKRTLQAGESAIYEEGKGWDDSLLVTGNETVSGNLSVAGNAAITGNTTLTGTLAVTGAESVGAANAITAFATGGQASATQLTKDVNRVTVCASNNDSVKLPAATAGRRIFVKNASANTLAIFPASGEVINALAADAAYSLATVKGVLFVCAVAGTWDTILTA